VSEVGRFAVVTNVRSNGARAPSRVSRGALVKDFLMGRGTYAVPSEAELSDFNPFNLILVEGSTAIFVSNRAVPQTTILQPGIYGLSNGALNEPWPKTVELRSTLCSWLAGDAVDPSVLLEGLRSERMSEEGGTERDRSEHAASSPVFIRNPVYGTRCSTVVVIGHDNSGLILERRYAANGSATGETALRFSWASAGTLPEPHTKAH